jgi:hypothetical protein
MQVTVGNEDELVNVFEVGLAEIVDIKDVSQSVVKHEFHVLLPRGGLHGLWVKVSMLLVGFFHCFIQSSNS